MKLTINLRAVFVALYIVCGVLTFGWCWNHYPAKTDVEGRSGYMAAHLFLPVLGGIVWPLFWGGKIALEVTK